MKDYNDERRKVSFFTPQASLIEGDILINKNGTVQKIYKYNARDLENLTDNALITYRNLINNVFKRLDGGFIVNFEAQRYIKKDYSLRETEYDVFNLIEKERYESFIDSKFFVNQYYFSISKKIPSKTESKVKSFFIDEVGFKDDINSFLQQFKKEIAELEALCQDLFLNFEPLLPGEIYTYLHSTVSDNNNPVKVPNVPAFISNYIADRDMINGFDSKIGDKYFRCITFNDTPLYTDINMLDGLTKLGVEFRWCTRYMLLDRFEAEAKLEKQRRIAWGQRYSIFESLKSRFTGAEPRVTNPEAEIEASMLQSEMQELANNNLSEGYYTITLILYADTKEELEKKVRIVNKFFIDKEFITIVEKINNSEAFLGSIPGNIYNNQRTSLLHSLHFSHLIPCSEVWEGNKTNKHFNDEALFLAKTKGTTAFYFNLHIKDLGHTMIVGKSGAGKSVLLGAIALNFMKYKNSKVIYFDKGGSQRILCYALNGIFSDIGNDKMSFQPFEKIDDPFNRKKAMLFLEELLELNNIIVTPEIQNSLWETLSSMASNPKELRTFTTLETTFSGDPRVKLLFKDYTLTGSQGELFDGSNNPLKETRLQVFEMAKISENPKGIALVLSYLFSEIEEGLNGNPTLIILDECWKFLDNPRFSNKIKEWLKVLRKSNASVVFATQELTDIDNSTISDTLISQSATRIFLPNRDILDDIEIYKKFGLNQTEIHNLAEAKPRKEYFLKNSEGARMFDLDLKKQGLNFLTKSEKQDQDLGKSIYEKVGGGNIFTQEWIKMMNLQNHS